MKVRIQRRRVCVAGAMACLASGAQAFAIDLGDPDLSLIWDTTVRYSAMQRLKAQSPGLSATVPGTTPGTFVGPNNTNQDDGNNNFNRGLVSNRIDLFTEADLKYKTYGLRFSGAAWYDDVYNRRTDNTSNTANQPVASEFTSGTRKTMGRDAEVLDAFVFGQFSAGGVDVTARLGKHTLLWGESLFFGANGIAGAMAPVDLVKILSVPNSQFKETARPTGKLSVQAQLNAKVTVGAYLGYEWQKSRLPASGSYLSNGDALGDGATRLRLGPTSLALQSDVEPKSSGQGGLQVRWRADSIDADLGAYAVRFHATGPSGIALSPATSSYRPYYHEGTQAYGFSLAKTLDEWSLAGEVSYRTNMPLNSGAQVALPTAPAFNNRDNTPYAVGETAHAQFSWLASLGPSFISREASFVGEVAWNKRVRTTRNAAMLNPLTDQSATALRVSYSPSYRQVLPGLDLTPSLGLGFAWGKSSALGPGFGVDKGGDASLGLGAAYLGQWFANLAYVHYLGPEGSAQNNAGFFQYKQSLKDRNFVSLSLRTTF
jgi:Protein of unknown function (DUF1302)